MLTADALALEYEALVHFTPTAEQRRTFASSGYAMPDGSFYIRPLPQGRTDLSNAIKAVGRSTPNAGESEVARRNAVRRHVIKRAKALGLMNMIPDTWNSDGTLKQSSLADEVEEFLAHYGVLGMRWGVHRERDGGGSAKSGSGSSRGDKRWETHAQDAKTFRQLHNAATKAMNQDLDRINNDPKFKDKDFTAHSPLRRQYYDAVQASMNQRYNEVGRTMKNPSGTRRLRVDTKIFNDGSFESHIYPVDVEHADAGFTVKLLVKKDAKGHILSVSVPDENLQQNDRLGEFLAHYGVLGMRWGVRRSNGDEGSSGSSRPKVSADAATARNLQGVVRKSGTSALSNQELQQLVTRLNLEGQYSNLSQKQVNAGRQLVNGILKDSSKQLATQFIVKNAPKGMAWVAKKTGHAIQAYRGKRPWLAGL